MTKQAMSELVVDLEAKGYLTRRRDTQDKRTKIIELSDRGWAAISAALAAFEEIERGLEKQLGTSRLQSFRRTLEILADSEAWIHETLDEPHNRDFVDSLLAAVPDDSPRSRHRDSTP